MAAGVLVTDLVLHAISAMPFRKGCVMPDTQHKKPQAESESQTKASRDKSSGANATVEAKTVAGSEGQPEREPEGKDDTIADRATQASQAAQNRKRDEHGRFATDDDTREPQRASRSRQDEYHGGYRYDDDYRRTSSRRDYDDYEARDRDQRNLFEGQDDYRRRERAPSRDDDQRGRWASQGYGHSQSHDDYERYSREYGDDYRRYSNQERRPDHQRGDDERYDRRYNHLGGGWAQTGERRYEDDYRDQRRSGWTSQGDQQRHRDWERDERRGYSNARRDYEEFDAPRHQSYRDRDDYSRRFQQDRYEEERRRDFAGAEDRTRYQYNDYHPVDQERSRYEQRRYGRDDRYEPGRGPRRRDDW
jgi:hypothetical protein